MVTVFFFRTATPTSTDVDLPPSGAHHGQLGGGVTFSTRPCGTSIGSWPEGRGSHQRLASFGSKDCNSDWSARYEDLLGLCTR